MKRTLALLALASTTLPVLAQTTYQAECVMNLTVQPAGPRTGALGLRFFNVQGNLQGGFASFGVAEFTTASLNLDPALGAVTGISSMTLLVQSNNAAFTRPGHIQAWLSRDLTTEVAQTNTGLRFLNAPEHLPHGVGTQFDPKIQVGAPMHFPFTGNVPANNGVTFEIPLTGVDAATETFLLGQLNDPSGRFRVLLSPTENTNTAATFSGYTATVAIGSPPVPPFGPTIRLVVTQGVASPAQSGTIRFTGRVANFPSTVDVEFRDPVTRATLHTGTASLSPTAESDLFNLSISGAQLPPVATYDIAVKPGQFLRRSTGTRNTATANTDLTFELVNGNVDDADNTVNIDDFLRLAAAYESSPVTDPNADLTGDGEVNIDDFLILAAVYEVSGDE